MNDSQPIQQTEVLPGARRAGRRAPRLARRHFMAAATNIATLLARAHERASRFIPARFSVTEPFAERLRRIQARKRSVLCVGLNPDPERMPPHLFADAEDPYARRCETQGRAFSNASRSEQVAARTRRGALCHRRAFVGSERRNASARSSTTSRPVRMSSTDGSTGTSGRMP